MRYALFELEQRDYDLIGLTLVATALYMSLVLYGSWDGGFVGTWLEVGLEHSVGQVGYAMPVAIAGLGVALIMRPYLKAPGAVNAGMILLLCALLLAFAASTAGLGPERPVRHGYFEPRFFTEHGGAIGETLYWASTTLFQRLGAHILAVLMMIAGALLITGTTISQLLGRAGAAARLAGDTTRELARTRGGNRWGEIGAEEISIPRSSSSEAVTESLDPGDAVDEPRGPDWEEGAEPAEDGAEASDTGQFAYEEVSLGGAAGSGEESPGEVLEEDADVDVALTPMGNRRDAVTVSDEIDYALPEPTVLEKGKADPGPDTRDRKAVGRSLLEALRNFGVEARLVGTVSGPHVSRYELQLAPGTKVSKVAQLKDDLAYALASTEIRILAPIPGKKAVGVEVPNQRRRLVRLGDIDGARPKGASPLVVWLGKDVAGNSVSADLAVMPHALVAGTTGSGKSGCINAMLCSILMHASPNDVRLLLVDPKRVELNHYERLPHLLTPVVTNPRLAANVLGNLIGEMENRYAVMGKARTRNLVELNKSRRRAGAPPLPHILCVIDELADLMMIAPAEVEDSIIRLAQKSRAVGIHLVLATQRPSTDVITGTIKVNVPARIAFAVASQVDSRVILDQGGAESLLGQGDMLFRPVGTSRLQRIQGAFVKEDEIARLTRAWTRQGEPEFNEELLEARAEGEEGQDGGELSPDQDNLLEEAARTVVQSQTASVSMLQRRLRVGYTRAGRLIDMLERRGIISGYEGSKPRQVLVSEGELPRVLGRSENGAGHAEPGSGSDSGAEAERQDDFESLDNQ